MQIFTLPSHQPSTSSSLPLTLISLEDWALVLVQGTDCFSYLQKQLTLNVFDMLETHHYLAAHCNANGKMWSNLRLFHYEKGLAYLVRRNLCEQQVVELKKYAIFSQVSIKINNNVVLLGIAGSQARSTLKHIFNILPDFKTPLVVHHNSTLLWFKEPIERFLIITTFIKAKFLKDTLYDKALFNNSMQWLALEIEAGIPVIDTVTSSRLMPQATNLQALNAISFEKGCYIGQEMIARAKFCGVNKRALYWLVGKASKLPKVSSSMEIQIGNKWRRTGIVLSAVQIDDGSIWVQIILNNNIKSDSILRVEGDKNSELIIKTLPYSVV